MDVAERAGKGHITLEQIINWKDEESDGDMEHNSNPDKAEKRIV